MSLVEYLIRLNGHEEQTSESTDHCQPPFPPGTPVITVDEYLIEATTDSVDNGSSRLAYNRTTGQLLNVRIYDHRTFHAKAHLLFADVHGVCRVQDVKSTSDGVLVFTPPTHGDLHQYLREKKRLTEPQAALLFRQIVEMVADAHHQKIALRDIKLKKFVFADEFW